MYISVHLGALKSYARQEEDLKDKLDFVSAALANNKSLLSKSNDNFNLWSVSLMSSQMNFMYILETKLCCFFPP